MSRRLNNHNFHGVHEREGEEIRNLSLVVAINVIISINCL